MMGITIGILLLLVSGSVIEAIPTLNIEPMAQYTGTTLTLTCELTGFTNAAMKFKKDGTTVYNCPYGGVICDDSGGVSDCSEVDWSQTNKGIVTISNANQTRDGGDWECAAGGGGGGTSVAVMLVITEAATTTPISQAGFSALVIIGSIYGTFWILAWIVVLLVIYCTDQKRLPRNLCTGDGLLKNWWIWLLLFICVPFVPFVVAIWLITKRSGKPTKPVISLKPASVNVGGTAKFTCTSSSTTDPAESGLTMIYTWRCNGVDIWSWGRYMVSGQTLTVTKVVQGDASDTFTCLAREGSGLTSDESDSARIVITKPTSGTKPGHYGESDQLIPLLMFTNDDFKSRPLDQRDHCHQLTQNKSDPEKGSPRKLPESSNPEDGFQSNRLSPLEVTKLSNITETQQAKEEEVEKEAEK